MLNECIVGTAAFALQECFRPDVKMTKSALLKSKLRIGDVEGRPEEAIELNIRTSKCTAVSRPPSLKRFAKGTVQPDRMEIDGADLYVPLERKTEYVVQKESNTQEEDDDDKTEGGDEEIVEKEELVRGYKYGASFVPVDEDEFERLEPNPGIDICGFFDAKNVSLPILRVCLILLFVCGSTDANGVWVRSSMSGLTQIPTRHKSPFLPLCRLCLRRMQWLSLV